MDRIWDLDGGRSWENTSPIKARDMIWDLDGG